MKILLLFALAGWAISFAVPSFAQQTNTPDPQLRQQLLALAKKFDDAYNNNDPVALAPLYTEEAVLVTDQGPIYGREAIEKHHVDDFQKVHFSNWLTTYDEYSPHIIGTAGNEMWENGTWSGTIQGQNFGPIQIKGYHSSIAVREGGIWKKRMVSWNVNPAPAATPSQQTNTPDPKLRQPPITRIKAHTDALDKNDAAAVAANFTEDGILVTPGGAIFGREAIEKYYTDVFKQIQLSNNLAPIDDDSPHIIGTDTKEMWAT